MKNYDELYNAILETLDNMTIDELVAVHNTYCEYTNVMDEYVHDMEDFNDFFVDYTPLEILRAVYIAFDINDDYFYFDGYGHACSGCIAGELNIFTDDIATFIVEDGNSLNDYRLQEILDEFEDDEE